MKSATSKTFKTPVGTLAFGQGLFKARAVTEGAVAKYSCTAIFDNSVDRSVFEEAVKEVLLTSWGDKGLARFKQGLIRSPFLKGDGPEARSRESGEIWPGFGPDKWFIRPQSGAERPPFVRYRDPNIQATEEEVYSGCRGFWVMNAFSWNHPQSGDGVSFSMSMFQKTGDGERLGGSVRIDPEQWFDKTVADQGEAPKETHDGRGAGGLFS